MWGYFEVWERETRDGEPLPIAVTFTTAGASAWEVNLWGEPARWVSRDDRRNDWSAKIKESAAESVARHLGIDLAADPIAEGKRLGLPDGHGPRSDGPYAKPTLLIGLTPIWDGPLGKRKCEGCGGETLEAGVYCVRCDACRPTRKRRTA